MRAYDPAAAEQARRLVPRARDLCATRTTPSPDADVLAVLTEWDEFRWLDFDRVRDAMRRPRVVDARNLLDPAAMRRRGFAYDGRRVADGRDRRHRRRRVPRVAPLRRVPRSAATRSSRSTTCRPAAARTSPHLADAPGLHARARATSCDEHPGRRAASTAVLHFASPASPPEYLAHAARDARRRLARHPQRARPRARQRRALPARVDERDLRRPARAPAARETTTATSTRSARARCTTRRSASPRR